MSITSVLLKNCQMSVSKCDSVANFTTVLGNNKSGDTEHSFRTVTHSTKLFEQFVSLLCCRVIRLSKACQPESRFARGLVNTRCKICFVIDVNKTLCSLFTCSFIVVNYLILR